MTNTEKMEEDLLKYEKVIRDLTAENLKLNTQVKNYENIIFAIRSIAEINN